MGRLRKGIKNEEWKQINSTFLFDFTWCDVCYFPQYVTIVSDEHLFYSTWKCFFVHSKQWYGNLMLQTFLITFIACFWLNAQFMWRPWKKSIELKLQIIWWKKKLFFLPCWLPSFPKYFTWHRQVFATLFLLYSLPSFVHSFSNS